MENFIVSCVFVVVIVGESALLIYLMDELFDPMNRKKK